MAAKRKHNHTKLYVGLGILIAAELVFLLVTLSRGKTFAILQPAGTIASQQRDLILFASALSLFVIVPVFVLLGFILWRYRDSNVKAKYRPNWDGSKKLESIWWGLPTAIIIVLAVVTYRTSHSLDPFKELSSTKPPITIQVVALQWKWLFIYPDDQIATINYVQIPVDTPVKFEITSDAPMNSFWVPQLGGQIYTMTGMQTELNLMADTPGTYDGSSANISGEGFAGMKFKVVAGSEQQYNQWLETAKSSNDTLDKSAYEQLREPTKNQAVALYKSVDTDLYDTVMSKYMSSHGSSSTNSHTTKKSGHSGDTQ